jgi:heme A synthase
VGLVAAVVVQALIGRSGVFTKLPVWNSATHGVLAQVLLCMFALIAFALAPGWDQRYPAPAATVRTSRKLTTTALGFVFLQVLVGAVLRHGNDPAMLWLHVGMALVTAFTILIAAAHAAGKFEADRGFQRLLKAILILLVVQIGLGFAALAVRGGGKWTASPEQIGRALTISGHVACGALTMLAATLLCAKAWRTLLPVGTGR